VGSAAAGNVRHGICGRGGKGESGSGTPEDFEGDEGRDEEQADEGEDEAMQGAVDDKFVETGDGEAEGKEYEGGEGG
jgi:hypothetical protein